MWPSHSADKILDVGCLVRYFVHYKTFMLKSCNLENSFVYGYKAD